jgi:hypothetical protein
MKIHKTIIGIFFSLMICLIDIKAQNIRPQDLYGKWKVKDILYLQMIGNETAGDYKDRMKIYHESLRAKIKISSNGIEVLTNVYKNNLLDVCDSNLFNNHFIHKKIVLSNDSTIRNDGSEMIDSNIVGNGFIKRLDKDYWRPTLTLMDTNCKQGFGNYTMKICIVSRNKIGLFTGANLIILERSKYQL